MMGRGRVWGNDGEEGMGVMMGRNYGVMMGRRYG